MNFSKCMAAMLLAATMSIGFTACSSDDDDVTLTTPEYESSAAKYDITTSGSPYSSIELTASGNYIITEAGYGRSSEVESRSVSDRKKSFGIFAKRAPQSRAEFGGFKYGTFTKIGENQYNLAGFGTITIVADGGNNYDLDIVRNNGQTMTLGANRDNMYSSSAMTDNLCRTWRINKINEKEWEYGYLDWEETYKPGEGSYDDPYEVIFTKAGSYIVCYMDGTLDIAIWKWENESKGQMRYSWNIKDINDPDDSGVADVKFSGNTCEITSEGWDTEYRKYSMTTWMTPL